MADFLHVRVRLRDRYGIRGFQRSDYSDLVERLREEGFDRCEEKSNGDLYVEFRFRGQLIKAVWSARRRCLATVLPRRAEPPVRAELRPELRAHG